MPSTDHELRYELRDPSPRRASGWRAVWSGFVRLLGALIALAAILVGRRKEQAPRTSLVVDDAGLHRLRGEARVTLARWSAPFGVTLFVPSRGAATVGLLVITTEEATRSIALELDPRLPLPVTVRPCLVAWSESGASEQPLVPAADARLLVEAMIARAPAAFGRLRHASDGDALSVDAGTLHIERSDPSAASTFDFDLAAPLGRETFTFLEGPVLYRALTLRQRQQAVTLVTWMAEPSGADDDVARAAQIPVRTPPSGFRLSMPQLLFAALRAEVERAPEGAQAPITRPPPPLPARV